MNASCICNRPMEQIAQPAPPARKGETRAGGVLPLGVLTFIFSCFSRGWPLGGLVGWGAPPRNNNIGHRQTVPALPGNNRTRTMIMEPIPPSRIGDASRPRCMTISLAPPTKAGPFSRSQLLVNQHGPAADLALRRPQRPRGQTTRCGRGYPVRVLGPLARAAITRRPIQVLLAWDGRIADARIAPAIAVAQQA
jgi:hypothetical protein